MSKKNTIEKIESRLKDLTHFDGSLIRDLSLNNCTERQLGAISFICLIPMLMNNDIRKI